MSLVDLWSTMGPFAKFIVVLLLAMSLWSWSVTFKKLFGLRKAIKETKKFAPEFSRFLQEEQMEGAIALAGKYKNSHVARVLVGALEEIKPLLRDGHVTAADINSAERAIERNQLILISELKRGTGILATVGATAPFVGLLGTVVGIITAFQGIAATGSGGLGAVSAGIAEALVETALGLVVAIPAVWFYNYLTGRIEYFNVEMDNSSSELVDYFIKKTA